MSIINYILDNWILVPLIAIALTVAIVAIRKGEIALIKHFLFRLVNEAVGEYKNNGIGKLNKAAMVTWLYVRVPTFLRLFITTAKIEKLIDDVIAHAKEMSMVKSNM